MAVASYVSLGSLRSRYYGTRCARDLLGEMPVKNKGEEAVGRESLRLWRGDGTWEKRAERKRDWTGRASDSSAAVTVSTRLLGRPWAKVSLQRSHSVPNVQDKCDAGVNMNAVVNPARWQLELGRLCSLQQEIWVAHFQGDHHTPLSALLISTFAPPHSILHTTARVTLSKPVRYATPLLEALAMAPTSLRAKPKSSQCLRASLSLLWSPPLPGSSLCLLQPHLHPLYPSVFELAVSYSQNAIYHVSAYETISLPSNLLTIHSPSQ